MKSLYHAIDNNTTSDHGSKWKQRMMIALHILRLYRPIKILDPVNYGPGIHDLNIQCCASYTQNVVFWIVNYRDFPFRERNYGKEIQKY